MTDTLKRSPTDTIIAAMEEANKAQEVLVIMTSEDGNILTLSSTSIVSARLGMLEMAKAWLLRDAFKDDES